MEPPSRGLLQDAGSAPAAGRFRPYASATHRVTRGRYITSNDRRGYIPVYEYPLNGQWIMMDIDDGYILWTGIWKALGNAKADIVKMLESQPDLAPQLRRVRGGYLKIQGTWMPYEVALRLARRVAWTIREDLIPLFGPTFPSTCLTPDQPGYGQILGSQKGKRRGRRAAVPLPLSATLPPPQPSDFDTSPGDPGQQTRQPGPSSLPPLSAVTTREHPPHLFSPSQIAGASGTRHDEYRGDGRYSGESTRIARYSYTTIPQTPGHAPHGYSSSSMAPPPPPASYGPPGSSGSHHLSPSSGPIRESAMLNTTHGTRGRFSPYQNVMHSRHRSGSIMNSAFARPSPVDLPPLTIPSPQLRIVSATDVGARSADMALGHGASSLGKSAAASSSVTTTATLPTAPNELINLPPIQTHAPAAMMSNAPRRSSGSLYSSGSGSGYSLPPISALNDLPPPLASGSSPYQLDSAAVLKRLAVDDEVLGESRRASFIAVGDGGGSHRDDDDDDGHAVEPPTLEQLWRRRRSLSEPPLNPDSLPNMQPTWSAAPNISLDPSSDPSPTRVRPSSFGAPASPSGQEISYSDARSPSPLSGPSSPFFGHQYKARSLSLLRGGLESRYPVIEENPAESSASSSRIDLLSEGYTTDRTGGSGKQSAMDEGHQTPRQFTASMPAEPWRPHAYSRTPTPLKYPAYQHVPSTHTHSLPQPAAERSSYQFGAESPTSREEAQLLLSSGGRRTRNDRAPTDRFHFPSSRQTRRRSEDL